MRNRSGVTLEIAQLQHCDGFFFRSIALSFVKAHLGAVTKTWPLSFIEFIQKHDLLEESIEDEEEQNEPDTKKAKKQP